MVLKNVFPAMSAPRCWRGAAGCRGRVPPRSVPRPRSFRALLSPKPLGPASRFVPGPLDVTGRAARARKRAWNRGRARSRKPSPSAEAEQSAQQSGLPSRQESACARGNLWRSNRMAYARAKLARRHGNPLDAQASIRGSRSGRAVRAASATGSGKSEATQRLPARVIRLSQNHQAPSPKPSAQSQDQRATSVVIRRG